MHINFFIDSHEAGILSETDRELCELFKNRSDFSVITARRPFRLIAGNEFAFGIILKTKKSVNGRSALKAYTPIQAEQTASRILEYTAKETGLEYCGVTKIRPFSHIPQIIIEISLTPSDKVRISSEGGLVSKALYRGICDCFQAEKAAQTAENAEEFETFLSANPVHGYIRVQTYSGRSPLPLAGVKITVSKTLTEKYVLSTVFTNPNGQTPIIALPTKPAAMSQSPGNSLPYTSYDITAEKENYINTENLNIPIFENILSVQPIRMNTDTGGTEEIFDEKDSYKL